MFEQVHEGFDFLKVLCRYTAKILIVFVYIRNLSPHQKKKKTVHYSENFIIEIYLKCSNIENEAISSPIWKWIRLALALNVIC